MHGFALEQRAATDARLKREDSKGKFFFSLETANGPVVGTGEQYVAERARESGVLSAMKNVPGAQIEDLTACSRWHARVPSDSPCRCRGDGAAWGR